jgi:L,D-transpeptidase catalytic domain
MASSLDKLGRAALALAALAAAMVAGGCGGESAQRDGASAAADRQPTVAEPARPVSAHPERPRTLSLSRRGHPIVWVRPGEEVAIRSGPGGGKVIRRVGPYTEFRSRTVFSVVRREGRWAGVPTPFAGNGELGWVKLDPRVLRAGWVPDSVVVDLSEFRAELMRGDRVKRSFTVAIGAPGSPTPTGRFAVTDTFRGDINPAYGCCAVALTAIQPALPSGWLGGNRIAIHGTTGPLGVAVSHGCVRAADADVNALVREAPPGTPVIIHE